MKTNYAKNLVLAALCLALGLLLPSVFHLIGAGPALLPMHIPVLLCGLVCGWQYGALVGALAPLLSSLLTGMPPLFPTGTAMVFELCAYGLLAGLLYRRAGGKLYLSLAGAMLGGRAVSGAANALLMGMAGRAYGLPAFVGAAFVTALPGIVIQLVFLPLIVVALQRAGVAERPARRKGGRANAANPA